MLLFILLGIALVVPLLTPYSSGPPGVSDQVAEMDTIQTAMYVWLADNNLAEVKSSAYAVQDWNSYPATLGLGLVPLSNYLHLTEATTKYFYCWDATGLITQQSGPVRCS